jgi:hypothetical protein
MIPKAAPQSREPGAAVLPTVYRVALAAGLAVPILWLLYLATAVQRDAPAFRPLLKGLGMELPNLTKALFASYPWWWLAPILSALAALDVLRRARPSRRYFALVLTASLLLALALHAWLYKALSLPLDHILDAIG